tara:strand:- start:63515 stop:64339 length:825 start_codon:yes stop_codon:yes gene_type:complete
MLKIMMISTVFLLGSVAYADDQAPVEDLSAPAAVQTDVAVSASQLDAMTLQQRVARLENVVKNQSQAANQSATLQQSLQDLRGQVEVLTNDNQMLREQQRKLYMDLNQRLTKLEGGKVTAVVPMPVDADAKANPDEYAAYQKAYNFIPNHQFVEATTALQAFLKQYPKGAYTPNANYWLGEVLLAQGKADEAQQQFQTVVQQYPKNNKVPDAMLKLAFINYDKGNIDAATKQLQEVQKQFPNTTAARLAAAKLVVINQSKNNNQNDGSDDDSSS